MSVISKHRVNSYRLEKLSTLSIFISSNKGFLFKKRESIFHFTVMPKHSPHVILVKPMISSYDKLSVMLWWMTYVFIVQMSLSKSTFLNSFANNSRKNIHFIIAQITVWQPQINICQRKVLTINFSYAISIIRQKHKFPKMYDHLQHNY